MKILKKVKFIPVFLLIIVMQFIFMPIPEAHAATAPNLGAADSYAVFGKSGVTNDAGGTTHIWGNVGADDIGTITNLIPGQVGGTIIAPAATVQTDATAAYLDLMAGTQGTPTGLDLAGTHTVASGNPITPGVYTVGATTMNGAVELSGAGVYIFRSDSSATISTGSSANMILTNGACASNVFWAIPASMTIGSGAHIEGTIIASTGNITLGTGAALVGRAISLTKNVTLLLNQITQPTCAAATPTPTPTSTPTSTPTPTPTSSLSFNPNSIAGGPPSAICSALNYVAPIIIESRRIDADSIFISWGPYSGINTFNVQYGFENGKWLYSTNVTGFSTTINDLPPNQPIWAKVAAADYCSVGTYGEAKLVGAPSLPYTGMDPHERSVPWSILIGIFLSVCFVYLTRKGERFPSL